MPPPRAGADVAAAVQCKGQERAAIVHAPATGLSTLWRLSAPRMGEKPPDGAKFFILLDELRQEWRSLSRQCRRDASNRSRRTADVGRCVGCHGHSRAPDDYA